MSETFALVVWKRMLPFAAALASGVCLAGFADLSRPRTGGAPAAAPSTTVSPAPSEVAPAAWVPPPLPTVSGEPPTIHVLSPMLMSEVFEMEQLGGYEPARILSPPGVAYVPASPRPYRQGVLQVNFLFGTDGRISEVTPVGKRVMCGPCLEGERGKYSRRVVWLDESDPRFREFLRAAEAELKRIEFVPARAAGRPYPTHGFAECVFRLD